MSSPVGVAPTATVAVNACVVRLTIDTVLLDTFPITAVSPLGVSAQLSGATPSLIGVPEAWVATSTGMSSPGLLFAPCSMTQAMVPSLLKKAYAAGSEPTATGEPVPVAGL